MTKKSKKEKRKEFEPSNAISAKKLKTNTNGVTILLFYAYVEPMWTKEELTVAIEFATKISAETNVGGRLRVAQEGFNGTMTGSYHGIREFTSKLVEWNHELFGKVDFKYTDNLPDGQLFPGALKVMRVKELVNYGLEEQPPLKLGGVHLEAEEYHKMMEKPNTVIIDVRNSYEAEIGRFQPPEGGAEYIDPKMRVSTEFPKWVDDNKTKLEGKQIMMYCTGGIRCERASALLRQKGLDNIYQMRGGIHRYLEHFNEDGGHWIGKNYTFDKRFAHGAENAGVISKCVSCNKDWDKYRGKKRCPGCGVPLLICEECQEKGLEKSAVCSLCKEQKMGPKTKKPKEKKRGNKCGYCDQDFKSRNEMFKHINETGHYERKRK